MEGDSDRKDLLITVKEKTQAQIQSVKYPPLTGRDIGMPFANNMVGTQTGSPGLLPSKSPTTQSQQQEDDAMFSSVQLRPIKVVCDAPVYDVVKASGRIGMRSPEDVRWRRQSVPRDKAAQRRTLARRLWRLFFAFGLPEVEETCVCCTSSAVPGERRLNRTRRWHSGSVKLGGHVFLRVDHRPDTGCLQRCPQRRCHQFLKGRRLQNQTSGTKEAERAASEQVLSTGRRAKSASTCSTPVRVTPNNTVAVIDLNAARKPGRGFRHPAG
jgi:hypothetical protein